MNETTDKLDYQEVVPVETQAAVTASQQQEIARFTRKKPKKKKIIMGDHRGPRAARTGEPGRRFGGG